MRKMKNSGIQGIGYIPENYVVSRIKYFANIYGRIGFRGYTQQDLVDDEEGAITLSPSNFKDMKMNYEKCSYLSWEKYYESPEIMINKGDILFVKTGSSYGKNCYVDEMPMECTINPQLIVFKNIKGNSKWFSYFLQTKHIQNLSELSVVGGTIPTMSQEKIGNFSIVIPSIEEQNDIADFLDDKCKEIDDLSSDIQYEIDILESYKRSVIVEAVTKGLDRNVPMKDSGMPWIGMIPSHWFVEKVKYHLTRKEPKNQSDKQVLSVYREYGVIPKDSRDDNHNVTSEDTSKYKYVRPGNLVINKMKAWQGSMGVSEYEGIVSPAYFIYHFTDDLLTPKYIHYLFRNCYKDEFRRISGGIREGQWDLNPNEFANTMILIPPLQEQEEIIKVIKEKTTEIDEIIVKKREQLEVLAEYKNAVIYEYVTGKKEVDG